MSLLALNRTLLLVTLLLAPLSAGAEDTPPADREDAAAFAERMARCVSNLSSADLDARRVARQELQDADAAALPALEEGALDSQRERSVTSFDLIQRLVNSDDEQTSTQALEAVRRLAESEDGGVAGRARSILDAVELTGESTAIAMLEAEGCHVRRGPTGEVAYVMGIQSDRQLALLKSLTFGRVSMLSMSGAGITDAGLKHLAEISAVRSLSINRTSITDAGLKTLCELQNVDSLNLGAGNYTAEGLRELGENSRFRSLAMREVAPEHLPVLHAIPQLRSLSLDGIQFSEAEVGLLNDLDGINMSLNLRDATDEDLAQVGQLKNLSNLDIYSGNGVTDAGIQSLTRLPLKRLTINSSQLTDAALAYLGSIKSLESLFLTGMQLSDSGLQHLHKLENLRSLALSRSNVTDEAVLDLQEALPNLRSIYDIDGQVAAVRAPGAVPRPPVRSPELTERERELNQKLAEILNDAERDALNQLTNPDQQRSEVGVTVDEDDGLVNLFFRRNLRAEDTDLLERISKLGVIFFSSTRNTATDEDLSHLRGVGMRGIMVRGADVTDAGLASLATCPQLETLNLMETQVTDAGFARVCEIPNLTNLALRGGTVTDAGLAHLTQSDQLVSLSLSDCDALTDDSLRHLSSLVNLESLTLSGIDGLTSASLIHLTRLGKLKTLRVYEMQLNQADLAHLSLFENLETLAITSSNLTDEGLQHVVRLPALTELFIGQTEITDAGLATLAQIRRLTGLSLDNTNITDAGLQHVARMTEMSHLTISNTSVTDAGLPHLEEMTRLQRLNLRDTQISDQGLSHLSGLRDLETLYLERTKITDAGLEHLEQLQKLTYLFVGGTSVTPGGVEQFQSALPDCSISTFDASRASEELQQRREELERSRENLRQRLPTPPPS